MADSIDARAVLSVFAPPPAFRFVRGFVVTHDLNASALAGHVLPELADVTSTEPRRRILDARSELSGTELLVLAAADRITWGGPALPPGVTVVPVRGRRLHAKFGLLQYASPTGVCRTRAFVSSANLTRPALFSNHEFIVIDEVSRHQRHLAFDLLAATHPLLVSEDLGDTDVRRLKALLRRMRIDLPAGGKPTGRVEHSLGKQADLTRRWSEACRSRTPVSRLTIVSPGFAPEGARLSVVGLDKVLALEPDVRLVTSVNGSGRPECSESVRNKLGARLVLEIPAPPATPTGRPRRLHGKLLGASVARGRVELLIGSANLTAHGLGGKNRELVYTTNIAAGQFEELLAGIEPTPAIGEPVAPTQSPLPDVIDQPASQVCAVFRPTSGGRHHERRWTGELDLSWEGSKPRRILHDGRKLRLVQTQALVLNSDAAVLDVYYSANGDPEVVPVTIADAPDQFWDHPPDPEDEPDDPFLSDPFLRLLLADLRHAARAESESDAGAPGDGDDSDPDDRPPEPPRNGPDDRFATPLEQRLVLLVRHRNRLDGEVADAELDEAVERFLAPEGAAAVLVGSAAVRPSAHVSSSDPLIAAFAKAVAAIAEEAP